MDETTKKLIIMIFDMFGGVENYRLTQTFQRPQEHMELWDDMGVDIYTVIQAIKAYPLYEGLHSSDTISSEDIVEYIFETETLTIDCE